MQFEYSTDCKVWNVKTGAKWRGNQRIHFLVTLSTSDLNPRAAEVRGLVAADAFMNASSKSSCFGRTLV